MSDDYIVVWSRLAADEEITVRIGSNDEIELDVHEEGGRVEGRGVQVGDCGCEVLALLATEGEGVLDFVVWHFEG